ncbi:MAG: beta-hydroxyacyl-ACP dehydratase [Chloroflexi bacterium]|nr:beta-hydroxyacyl-ACP dehydratase [Chloroflexota bacterium]
MQVDAKRSGRKRALVEPGPGTLCTRLGRGSIERILPHRDPFLFIDAIVAVDLQQRAVWAQRRIAPEDPVFVGHFPDYPVYPGALLIEAMGQAGLCSLYFCRRGSVDVQADGPSIHARALRVHDAVFVSEVHPGDELTLLAQVLEHDALAATLMSQTLRGQEVCAVATLEAYLVD